MPKEERQIKEITDNDLDTGRDLITENYELEILTLKDKVDLRRFSRSFLKVDKLLKSIFTGKEDKFPKNSGFNREKTDLAENDTNKVFSAKGAFDLKTSLENLITNLKNTLTTHVGSLVSTTQSGHMSKEDKVKLNGIANNANNYIHPTTSGNKHIPTGGGTNYFVKWASDGTGTWGLIDWSFIQNRPSTFPPSSHTHDDRYFTEGEINERFKNFCPFPINSVLMLLDNSNPATLFPGTTWQKQEGRFLQGTSGSEGAGGIGGASSVTLSTGNLPSHNHSISVSISNGGNHRHQVDNHIHSQPSHAHTIPMSTPGYFSGFNWNSVYTGVMRSGNGDTSRAGLSSGGDNTGGSAPYTNYSGDHGHGASASCGNTGGGAAFSILPPYLRVNIWKRLT